MELKQALIEAINGVFPMFGVKSEYLGESEEIHLESAAQVNIMIGFTSGISGNIVMGLDKPAALKIVSRMMGGVQINEFDTIGKSALCELTNMIVGTVAQKIRTTTFIDISPPTMIIGERIFLLIGRLRSYKLKFKLGEDIYYINFSVD